MSILKCPVCGEEMNFHGRMYRCVNKHTFDVSKQGYSNFLINQSQKIHGDSKDMLLARKYIQDQGYYQDVRDGVLAIIQSLQLDQILDIGCGVGYYTSSISDKVSASVIGVDISKDALKIAAREDKKTTYLVASNNQLPLKDDSVDLVTTIFSPVYEEEIVRVLKDNGYILVVSPNQDHLIELKKIIYQDIIQKDEQRNDLKDAGFMLKKEKNIHTVITLDQKAIGQLFLMTPHYWTSSVDGKKRLYSIPHLKTTIDVTIKLYQYRNNLA